MEKVIKIDSLSKVFIGHKTRPGIRGALKNLFWAQKEELIAIENLSFEVKAGESVAFIGPNGAGKSTTIKMLTGILYPTSGSLEVLGMQPWKDRYSLGFKIGTIFGQRTQLWHNLPPMDTFSLLAKIYEINPKVYKQRLEELVDLFEIKHLLQKPVCHFSLGERMKCEIIASLLHAPKILFLDEPTIGLDINAKLMIRSLLNKLCKEHGTTLFLTSHDMADIEQVCGRVLVLDKGIIIADKTLKDLKKTYMKRKILSLVTDKEYFSLNLPGVKVIKSSPHFFCCEVNTEIAQIDSVIKESLKLTNLKDITIEDPSMEEVIRLLYNNNTYA